MDKREQIINAWVDLVTSNGIQASSMSKIAKHAGVSVGTIYIYFSSKSELVDEAFFSVKMKELEFIQQGMDEFHDIKTVKEQFLLLYGRLIQYYLENRLHARFNDQFTDAPELSGEMREKVNDSFVTFFNLVERGIAEGIFRDLPVKLILQFVFGAVLSLMNYLSVNHKNITHDEVAEYLEMIWGGVANSDIEVV